MRQRLQCPQFLDRHRAHPRAFRRRRHLTFARVMLLVLQKSFKSLQCRLKEFFEHLALEEDAFASPLLVTPGAWTQARAKLSHTAFIALNEEAILASFYSQENHVPVRRWRGHRLCAIDGSYLHLPAREEVGRHFGWAKTINQTGACAARHAMANASVYYDVLNRLGLDARLEPYQTAERQLGALCTCRPCGRVTW